MNNKKITQELVNELVDIEIETADYSDRADFDSDLEYYQYSAKKDSYVDLLLRDELVSSYEAAEELQYLVLKEIERRVENKEVI